MTAPKREKRKYRLLTSQETGMPIGKHLYDGPEGEVERTEHNPRGIVLHELLPGEVIETETDLCGKFNRDGHRKFEQVNPTAEAARQGFNSIHEMNPHARRDGESKRDYAARMKVLSDTAAKDADNDKEAITLIDSSSTLDSMTLDELKKHAAEEEIPLGKATKVEDVRRIVREWHLKPQASGAHG